MVRWNSKVSILEQLGYDPLPHWVEPLDEETKEKYPLVLIAGGGFMPFSIPNIARTPGLDLYKFIPKPQSIPAQQKSWV